VADFWQALFIVFPVDCCLTVVVCSISVLRSDGIGCWATLCFSSASPCCTYCLLLHQDKKLLLPQVENTEREEQSQQVLLLKHTHTHTHTHTYTVHLPSMHIHLHLNHHTYSVITKWINSRKILYIYEEFRCKSL